MSDARFPMKQSEKTAAWRLTDMHHVGLTVSDIERSIVFYREVLGMTSGAAASQGRRRLRGPADRLRRRRAQRRTRLQVLPESRQTLEVVQYLNHDGSPIDPATNRAGSSHLCLLVSDFHACHAELKAKGVDFKSEPVTITAGPNKGGMVIYLSDPDGYTIELFQPPMRPSHE